MIAPSSYIDGMVEKETYLNKKAVLIEQEQETKEKLKHVDAGAQQALTKVEEFVELVNNACLSYELATPEEKRELIKIVTSNFTAEGKSLSIKLNYPFKMVAERGGVSCGGPHRARGRTVLALVSELIVYFAEPQLIAA